MAVEAERLDDEGLELAGEEIGEEEGGDVVVVARKRLVAGEEGITVRAFDAPQALVYRLFPALTRRRRRELFTRYLRAISPLYATPA